MLSLIASARSHCRIRLQAFIIPYTTMRVPRVLRALTPTTPQWCAGSPWPRRLLVQRARQWGQMLGTAMGSNAGHGNIVPDTSTVRHVTPVVTLADTPPCVRADGP